MNQYLAFFAEDENTVVIEADSIDVAGSFAVAKSNDEVVGIYSAENLQALINIASGIDEVAAEAYEDEDHEDDAEEDEEEKPRMEAAADMEEEEDLHEADAVASTEEEPA